MEEGKRRWPLVVIGLVVWSTTMMVLSKGRKTPGRDEKALRERGDDLRRFVKVINFEKRYLAQWSTACLALEEAEKEAEEVSAGGEVSACGDYDDFCETNCGGRRCRALCGTACDQGWGAYCMLSALHDLDTLCHKNQKAKKQKKTPFLFQRRETTLEAWLNNTDCAMRTVCRACENMDSFGCQKATHAAAASYHRAHPFDNTLAQYDFDPHPHTPEDKAWLKNTTEDLFLNATTPADFIEAAVDFALALNAAYNVSFVDPFLRPDIWPQVAAQLEGDAFHDLCHGDTTFPDLPKTRAIILDDTEGSFSTFAAFDFWTTLHYTTMSN